MPNFTNITDDGPAWVSDHPANLVSEAKYFIQRLRQRTSGRARLCTFFLKESLRRKASDPDVLDSKPIQTACSAETDEGNQVEKTRSQTKFLGAGERVGEGTFYQ